MKNEKIIRIYFRKDLPKIPIYKNGKTETISLQEIMQKIAKKLNARVLTMECPLDDVCRNYCRFNPDMILFDMTTGDIMIVLLKDIRALQEQVNASPKKRNFSKAIFEKVKREFFEKISRN